MATDGTGRLVLGDATVARRSYDEFSALPVDQERLDGDTDFSWEHQTTLASAAQVSGSGTFFGKAQRTLHFEPSENSGWWFERTDLTDQMPIRVSISNVWTTVRNIVLCSGSPHNYMRMVEHIVALRVGLGLDNVTIKMDSGDPPLFNRGSMDLVEMVERAGIKEISAPPVYLTVKEPVTATGPGGSFVTMLPAEAGDRRLILDCAVNFRTAIGKQRIRFSVNRSTFRHGALARTNTTFWMMLYTKSIGKLFADIRHLGYTPKNILIAGKRFYFNKPGLMHNGKSLEAVWHRAALDLLAAVALIERGRLAGRILSYKAGHSLDVNFIRELHNGGLLVEMK
jgi:UDP-3-O-acyl-N-acetylglucosamine deacetylase